MSIIVAILLLTPFMATNNIKAQNETGIIINKPGAYEGYTLFSPISDTSTYLIDIEGKVIHKWTSDAIPGNSVYLTDEGKLIRTESYRTKNSRYFPGGGSGGRVRVYDKDSNVLWEYTLSDSDCLLHHDIELLPNGNILMIVWERIEKTEAVKNGRKPWLIDGDYMLSDKVIEVNEDGEIVWEWRFFDHLVQNFSKKKLNYGNPKENIDKLDINKVTTDMNGNVNPDWLHINSIDYNEELDQILLSSPTFGEIYIINHSDEEKLTDESGIIFRWGNPSMYGVGDKQDTKLFFQHNASWIEKGCPDEGNILIFNNGTRNKRRNYSSVDEINPVLEDNSYQLSDGIYLPENASWSYVGDPKTSFFSDHISGAQRLPNGNTLICSGVDGVFFEVTVDSEIVWKYINPFGGGASKSKSTQPDAQQQNPNRSVFRCTRYSKDYNGLKGIM